MKLKTLLTLTAFAATTLAAAAAQATVFVSAQDDIFLAGLTTPPTFPASQTQTAVSGNGAGLLPVVVKVTGGETLDLVATGTANCGVGCGDSGPDGNPQFGQGSIAGYDHVGPYVGTNNEGFQLVGVYNSGSNTPFVIGSGGSFVVPMGATVLYLGLPDGFSFQGPPGTYNDNTGGFTITGVSPAPEPATWAVMLVGFGGLGAIMRGQRRKQAQAAA